MKSITWGALKITVLTTAIAHPPKTLPSVVAASAFLIEYSRTIDAAAVATTATVPTFLCSVDIAGPSGRRSNLIAAGRSNHARQHSAARAKTVMNGFEIAAWRKPSGIKGEVVTKIITTPITAITAIYLIENSRTSRYRGTAPRTAAAMSGLCESRTMCTRFFVATSATTKRQVSRKFFSVPIGKPTIIARCCTWPQSDAGTSPPNTECRVAKNLMSQ